MYVRNGMYVCITPINPSEIGVTYNSFNLN